MSLDSFQQLQPLQQIQFLVPSELPDSATAAATAQRVAKYLAAVHPPQVRQGLLGQLVAEDPATHLPWLVHLFERLRLQQQVPAFMTTAAVIVVVMILNLYNQNCNMSSHSCNPMVGGCTLDVSKMTVSAIVL